MARNFETYIFDLDGTLLDTLPDLVFLTNKALVQAQLPARSEAEILSFVGAGVRRLLEQAVPINSSEEKIEEVSSYWYEFYPNYGTGLTKEYEGITDVLRGLLLQGRLGVLSNKFEQGVVDLVEEHFPGMFGSVHGESANIPRKPDPKGLFLTMKELDADPTTTVYIGDSSNDIVTARNAGIVAVGVTWGYGNKEALINAGADRLIDSPQELLVLS